MSGRVFLVDGLRVEVEAALARGVAGELLAAFPAAPEGAPALVLAAGRRGADESPAVPSFFHGSLRASVRSGAFLLRDGATTATVSADGRRVEVDGPAEAAEGASELVVLVALVLALRHHGLFHLHAAAAVAADGRGVLVAGTSGAGKTTLALALAAAGAAPLADDAVFLARRDEPYVLGLPRPFHLGERTAAAFPALAPLLGPVAAAGKRPLDAGAVPGLRSGGARAVPEVVLLPEIAAAARSTLEPVSPLDAFEVLLDSGALLVAEGMPAVREHLSLLRAIAGRARTVRVRLGEDVLREPAATARALLAAC